MTADLVKRLREAAEELLESDGMIEDIRDLAEAANRIEQLERIVAHQQERIEDGKKKAKKRRSMVSATMKKEAQIREENRILRSQVETLTQDLQDARDTIRKMRKLMEAGNA